MKFARTIPAFSLFIVTIAVLLYVTSIGIKNFFRYNIFRTEYKTIQASLAQETKTNLALKKELNQTHTEEYWEWEARKCLGYVKKDEVVYKFIRLGNH